MTRQLATIRIKDLRLRTYIGFNEEELNKKQDVVVNILITYDASAAAKSDSVEDACNYKILTKQIISLVEKNSFLLLEKMAAEIVSILASDEQVIRASVEVDKPHALRFSDSVSLAMEYNRD